MEVTSIFMLLVVGGVAGWLAGKVVKGGGFGMVGNIVIGVVGAVIGGWVFGKMGISAGGIFDSLVIATVGATILVFIVGLIKK